MVHTLGSIMRPHDISQGSMKISETKLTLCVPAATYSAGCMHCLRVCCMHCLGVFLHALS